MAGRDITISGLQEAQAWNLKAIASLVPGGRFARELISLTAELHRYAVTITHVQTGALRASHRIALDTSRYRGHIFIDPSAVNPRSRERVAEYAWKEEGRGGSHAFYGRTYAYAPLAVNRMIDRVGRMLQSGD